MRKDDRAIVRAASAASKAVDLLLGFVDGGSASSSDSDAHAHGEAA